MNTLIIFKKFLCWENRVLQRPQPIYRPFDPMCMGVRSYHAPTHPCPLVVAQQHLTVHFMIKPRSSDQSNGPSLIQINSPSPKRLCWSFKVQTVFKWPLLNDVMWCLFYAGYMVVDYLLWIICLLLLNVKSHPFCLKMLLFVWVTCRWSRLAIDCCCEWLPLTLLLFSILYVLFIWDSMNMTLKHFDEILRWGLRAKVV